MGLADKASMYDRHTRLNEGANVGITTPDQGNYYSAEGNSDSPFNSTRGPKMDQMVHMLNREVVSGNTSEVYGPAPGGDGNSPYQDLNGVTGPIFGDASGQGKQLGGVDLHESMLTNAYTKNGVTVGPSPGPSGNSPFQDMNGNTTNFGIGFTNPETGNYDGKYAYGLGPTNGHY